MSDDKSIDNTINSDTDELEVAKAINNPLKPLHDVKRQITVAAGSIKNVNTRVSKSIDQFALNPMFFPNKTGKKHSIRAISKKIIEKDNVITNNSENCINCNQLIKSHNFYSLRKFEEGTTEHKNEIKECINVCSATCLNDYQELVNVEEYHLYEVKRCASYYDCLKINNLRLMCTEENRLDYEPASSIYLPNIKMVNFCKPADAGIIKASLNIHKQLEESSKQIEESSKQNSYHFKITALMTILVIILTILNTYIAYSDTYEPLLNGINEKLELINNNILSLGDIIGDGDSSPITGVNLTNYSIPNNNSNISKFNI